jgi:hypothetical protein
MAQPLQLVRPKAKVKRRQRRLQVRYYKQADTPVDYPDAYGAPKTEKGVIKGAFVRIFMREYELVRVFDMKLGYCTLTIDRGPDGLPRLRFGKHVLGTVNRDGTIKYGT